MNDDQFVRLDLADLTAEQIAPLEAHFTPGWPDHWRDLARSHYVTLLSLCEAIHDMPPADCALYAVHLTRGIAEDLGGTQPYIPVGAALAASAKSNRVIELLRQRWSYTDVAADTGLTVSRVRQIEAAWRREKTAASQRRLFDFAEK